MADKKVSQDKITSVIAKEADGNIQITFTIPFPIIQKSQEDTLVEFAKDIEIPGFRKGQAPISKVKEKVSQAQLIEHSLGHLLPKALADAVTDNKLRIAIYPKFELISAKDDEAWQIRGITCELPIVELGEYKKEVTGALRSKSIVTNSKDSKPVSKEETESIVLKALISAVKIKIPGILIEQEADSRLSSLLARLEKLGLALESYLASVNKKAEDLRAEYALQAKDAISIDLALNKIAEEEKLTVDPAELQSAIKISESTNPSNKESQEESEDRKRMIESILRRRKALDFLMNLSS